MLDVMVLLAADLIEHAQKNGHFFDFLAFAEVLETRPLRTLSRSFLTFVAPSWFNLLWEGRKASMGTGLFSSFFLLGGLNLSWGA